MSLKRDCQINGVNPKTTSDQTSDNRSPKTIAKAFNTGFHRVIQRTAPAPEGSKDRAVKYKNFNAESCDTKCPHTRAVRRKRAFNNSTAFVEYNNPTNLHLIGQKRDKLLPPTPPQRANSRILLIPPAGKGLQRRFSCLKGRCINPASNPSLQRPSAV